jgi:hypothetical protein
MRKMYLLCVLITISTIQHSFCQNNFVRDDKVDSILRDYLYKNHQVVRISSNGDTIPLENIYKDTFIVSRLLSSDEVVEEISKIGLYWFGFSEAHGSGYIYFQHPDSIEFINKPSKEDFFDFTDRVNQRMNDYNFSLTDRIETLKNLFFVLSLETSD